MLSVSIDGEKSKTIPSRGLYKTSVECSGDATTGEWDYNAWSLVLNNVESNAKCNISFTSNLTEEEYDKYIEAGIALRRNTYRGKDITSYWKDGSLYTMISNGAFDDIYVGDYIIDNKGNKWLIADIDNYLGAGTASHHATIIPASGLMTSSMNDTNTAEGGYMGSKMVKETLPNYLSTYVTPVFGGHIITYKNYLTDSISATITNAFGVNTGASNHWAWYDRQIDLMSENNVYGAAVCSSSAHDIGLDNQQYALFQLKPKYKYSNGTGGRYHYWLKAVAYSHGFALADGSGISYYGAASGVNAVRPRFLIG